MYDSKATLEARLTEVREAIAKARKAQSYDEETHSVTRPSLKALLEEERWILSQIEAIENQKKGGIFNKVKFTRAI